MRDASLVASDCPFLGWSHLLLLAVGFICSRTTGAFPVRDSNPLIGFSDQVRLGHLYTANENTNMHLQITPEGQVSGSQDQNLYSVLEIKAVKKGVLVIRGKKSALFLCMDPSGHLYGSETHKAEDCNFKEDPQGDGHVLYFSEKHRRQLELQTARGTLLKAFLPLRSSIPLEWLHLDNNPAESSQERTVDTGSEDPLSMLSQGSSFGHVWE
ncbi:fibroblast growth factor 21-like [Ambystoma mexicanum]|uniref:fibroblast growth factor 21-like n=1 Tax=Ambystoma mexicanum TaxID=8296 RepID=UPI0037E81191